MNQKQYEEARALLAMDCAVSGFYIKEEETCAIGCLALAAGCKKEDLLKVNDKLIAKGCTLSPEDEATLASIRHKISSKFGLDEEDLRRIQAENDYISNPLDHWNPDAFKADKEDRAKRRREAVLKALRDFREDPLESFKPSE